MIPEKKIKEIDQAFENSKKRDLLSRFKKGSNYHNVLKYIIDNGQIKTFDFSENLPRKIYAHTKHMSRLRDIVNLNNRDLGFYIPYGVPEKPGSKVHVWTIEKRV